MKIAFLGNFEVDYSSENHHKKSLELLGHEVFPLQERQASAESILFEAKRSDIFIWVHTHGWKTPVSNRGTLDMTSVLRLLKEANIPSVTYHLDLWFGLDRQKDLETDSFYREIQHFFTVDKKMADWFNENTEVKGHYLQAGVFQDEMYEAEPTGPSDNPCPNDVIFVGSKGYHKEWPYRPQLINFLKASYGNRFRHIGGDGEGTYRGEKLNQLYANTKVVVGDSLNIGFNYPYYWSDRLYETIGRGGFIIFPNIKGIESEFHLLPGSGQELVTYDYGNFGELKDKIDYYIANEMKREKIRQRGFERCKQYTYEKRWQTIIDEVTHG